MSKFRTARTAFHSGLLASVLTIDKKGVPTNADKDSVASVKLAQAIVEQIGASASAARAPGQRSGNEFEAHCAKFLRDTFLELAHLRPGRWLIEQVTGRDRLKIARYQQYAHLVALHDASRRDPELAAALGSDYTITPDIIVAREAEADSEINRHAKLVDSSVSKRAGLRGGALPLLHASISCKWTIRSDRAQNSRTEALNLIKNRKGRLPHVVVVTAEPLPSRIAAIALGTGEIDCVYHFALDELDLAVRAPGFEEPRDQLATMTNGHRLRDIADLPLDLAA